MLAHYQCRCLWISSKGNLDNKDARSYWVRCRAAVVSGTAETAYHYGQL